MRASECGFCPAKESSQPTNFLSVDNYQAGRVDVVPRLAGHQGAQRDRIAKTTHYPEQNSSPPLHHSQLQIQQRFQPSRTIVITESVAVFFIFQICDRFPTLVLTANFRFSRALSQCDFESWLQPHGPRCRPRYYSLPHLLLHMYCHHQPVP